MQIKIIQSGLEKLVQENAPAILTAGGIVGTVATAVLSVRAGIKAERLIDSMDPKIRVGDPEKGEPDHVVEAHTVFEKAKETWPQFVPPVVVGTLTVSSIFMANRMSAQRVAALAAAYGLSQKQFDEYRAKVEEKLGVQKTKKVEDELAQDRVNATPGGNQVIIIDGGGEVLCFDQPTGRYFRNSMEGIRQAVNQINEEIIHHDHASANFFYEEIGLPPTTWGDEVGFNADNLVELSFSTVLSQENQPCLAIDFKRLPTADYLRRMWN